MNTNEEDSGLDKSEISIEIVNSTPCIPEALDVDVDVDISNLEIVLFPEENANNLTLEAETLGTAEAHINTSKICDSTCRADVELDVAFEDFGQYDLFKGLSTII